MKKEWTGLTSAPTVTEITSRPRQHSRGFLQ
jgi:hypothetical protein